jgi:parallel beta-helix repeat protein
MLEKIINSIGKVKQKVKRNLAVALTAGALLIPTILPAETLNVPQQYSTIQQAVDASHEGDRIIVAPGKYVESIKINMQSDRTLQGTIGDYNDALNSQKNTIINTGGSNFGAVYIDKSSSITLDSLVITGFSPNYYPDGGALFISDTDNIQIKNNILTKNNGAIASGVFCLNSKNILIEHNIIRDNKSYTGPAITILNKATTSTSDLSTITDNKVINNDSYGATSDAGIISVFNGDASILRNFIYNNTSPNWSEGILISSARGIIANNIISKSMGGIHCRNSPILIGNNTIYKNVGIKNGGGVYIDGENLPTIENNIIAENTFGGIHYLGGSSFSASYNDVYNNSPTDYVNCTAGTGSILQDPQFVDAEKGNFHLMPKSPCIDAGINIPNLLIDFEGNKRPQGKGYDIGSFESTPYRETAAQNWMKYK